MPKIGDREIKRCKATGKPIEMEYVGEADPTEDGEINGHPGWLCLHNGD